MSTQTSPTIYQHADHPEWGRGVILPGRGREDRVDLAFETGGRRIILKAFAAKLHPVPMEPDEASLLGEKLATRKQATGPIKLPKKKGKEKAPTATFAGFAGQLELFLKLYPGGLNSEKYTRDERAPADGPHKKGDKSAAIAAAKQAFRPEAFDADVAAVFQAALDLARSAGLAHPLDGATTLGSVTDEHRPAFVSGLRDLLYGSGTDGERFERFIGSIQVDAAKRPSWPLATMFAALVQPDRHVCVKPTAFQKQAALLGLPLEYTPTPSAAVYEQALAIAHATEAELKKAGQEPRDLMDVYSFICLTHGAKAPAAKPTAPPAA